MQVAEALVSPDCVHIGVDAVAGAYLVVGEGEPFPLRKGMDDFGLAVAQVAYGECDGTLHSVEVVVDTLSLEDEEGRGHAAQAEGLGQGLLEEILDELDAVLGLFRGKGGLVALGDDQVTHFVPVSSLSLK